MRQILTIKEVFKTIVQAKRYLTRKDPDYFNQLSEASRRTLEFQGGMMTDDEEL